MMILPQYVLEKAEKRIVPDKLKKKKIHPFLLPIKTEEKKPSFFTILETKKERCCFCMNVCRMERCKLVIEDEDWNVMVFRK